MSKFIELNSGYRTLFFNVEHIVFVEKSADGKAIIRLNPLFEPLNRNFTVVETYDYVKQKLNY